MSKTYTSVFCCAKVKMVVVKLKRKRNFFMLIIFFKNSKLCAIKKKTTNTRMFKKIIRAFVAEKPTRFWKPCRILEWIHIFSNHLVGNRPSQLPNICGVLIFGETFQPHQHRALLIAFGKGKYRFFCFHGNDVNCVI